jgi:aminodeoxyfutalosine synthase
LSFGANDVDGTVTEEKITHDAGTTEPQSLSEAQIAHLIREAGYEPVQRTTVYEEVTPRAAARADAAVGVAAAGG